VTDPEVLHVGVEGGALHVACWGEGPVVLGLHGITASSISLAPLAAALPDRRVVAPDLRGRGGSAGLAGPFGMRAHAEDCAAVLRQLTDEPAVVVGESMGAYVAIHLAATHPELVRKLVLVDGGLPLAVPEGVDVDLVIDAMLGPAIERLRLTFESEAAYLDYWRPHPALAEAWGPDVEAYLRYDLTGEPPALRSKVNEEAVRADARDTIANVAALDDALRRVRCPIHLLRATRNLANAEPALLPDDVVAPWRDLLPTLTDEVVPDTNHYSIIFGERGRAAVADAAR
jgi:pimeloyl-ACP methyl ester carboxylesterase